MEKIEIIKKETEELLAKMINKFEVEVVEELGVYQIIIKTEDEASTVIGKHGETIRSLQKILEVILYKKFNQPVEILVNVNDFREKQKERLEVLANEYAQKTQITHSPSFIRNLSSYERKLIHEYITKNYPDLTTYSIGEGRDRRLVIDLKTNTPVNY
ncbi:MAG: hypothetical protein NZM02_01085 [Patescibacteria group bacterium]|nr:hypothetical protein [Patescibacteria group bacterium]